MKSPSLCKPKSTNPVFFVHQSVATKLDHVLMFSVYIVTLEPNPENYLNSTRKRMTYIRAIIVPTAHGKSYMTSLGLPTFIREADSIVHCKATHVLRVERKIAQQTGSWSNYDKILGTAIKALANDGDIIMLASRDLADSMGIPIIGIYVLSYDVWIQNVERRQVDVSKYISCYNSACLLTETRYGSNSELYTAVKMLT